MTKSDLIEVLNVMNQDIEYGKTVECVNEVLNFIVEKVTKNEKIEIRGFGVFALREKNSRWGRNPKTGENLVIKASSAPCFKAGKDLKNRVTNIIPKVK